MRQEDNELLNARFRASMQRLEAGDVIAAKIGHEECHCVVLKTEFSQDGRKFLSVSEFSPSIVFRPYSKKVYWDESYGWLSTENGGVFLLSEHWVNTDKGGAKSQLKRHVSLTLQDEMGEIDKIFRQRASLKNAATDILNLIFGERKWDERAVMLLAHALRKYNRGEQ